MPYESSPSFPILHLFHIPISGLKGKVQLIRIKRINLRSIRQTFNTSPIQLLCLPIALCHRWSRLVQLDLLSQEIRYLEGRLDLTFELEVETLIAGIFGNLSSEVEVSNGPDEQTEVKTPGTELGNPQIWRCQQLTK
jgi:hypothetical protein